jgi:hypothetical protein
MTLRRRLQRLERTHPARQSPGPAVVFIAEAGGEIRAELCRGGGTLMRKPDESGAQFVVRVQALA